MTVLDTTKLSSEDIIQLIHGETLSCGGKEDLPTIIDVIEYLSSIENANILTGINQCGLLPRSYEEGKYMVISEKVGSNIPKLFPTSLSTFTLMRGQNDYYQDCKATLHRQSMSDEELLIKRIQTAEFLALLSTHPVFILDIF